MGAAAALLPAARGASAAKPPKPIEVTDRDGVRVTEEKWLKVAAATPDLVLGLDGEPYFLLTRPSAEADAPADARELLPYALRAECTHLGCLVGPWNPLSQRFVCPCHGSEYKRDGSVARGPAPKPLKLAKVGIDEQGQVVLEKWTEQDFRENV